MSRSASLSSCECMLGRSRSASHTQARTFIQKQNLHTNSSQGHSLRGHSSYGTSIASPLSGWFEGKKRFFRGEKGGTFQLSITRKWIILPFFIYIAEMLLAWSLVSSAVAYARRQRLAAVLQHYFGECDRLRPSEVLGPRLCLTAQVRM